MVTLPLAEIAKTLGKPIRPDTEPFTLNLSHMFVLADQGLDASGKVRSSSYTRFLFDPNSGKACTVSAIHKSFVASCVDASEDLVADSKTCVDQITENGFVVCTVGASRAVDPKERLESQTVCAVLIRTSVVDYALSSMPRAHHINDIPRRLFYEIEAVAPDEMRRDRPFKYEYMRAADLPYVIAAIDNRVKSCCAQCGQEQGVRECRGCCKVGYCSKQCQRAHWKSTHKEECAVLKAEPFRVRTKYWVHSGDAAPACAEGVRGLSSMASQGLSGVPGEVKGHASVPQNASDHSAIILAGHLEGLSVLCP